MLRYIPFIAIFAFQLSAADLSGRWAGTIEMNSRRIPFYMTLNVADGKISGFVSTSSNGRPMRLESSELRDDGLSFDIHDDANRPVHLKLTLTSGVLGGEATVGAEIWKVAAVPVGGGGGGDRIPIPASGSGVGVGSGAGSGVGSGVYRVGGGVSRPVLIHKVEPEYTEEARKAQYQGVVILYVEISPEGIATNIRVQRSLGLGLDEKAVECVKQWKFQPGEKDGNPVTVAATIEVNFRL